MICGRRFFHGPLPVKRAARSASDSGIGEVARTRATEATCSGNGLGQEAREMAIFAIACIVNSRRAPRMEFISPNCKRNPP